jgi:hypothetical protein
MFAQSHSSRALLSKHSSSEIALFRRLEPHSVCFVMGEVRGLFLSLPLQPFVVSPLYFFRGCWEIHRLSGRLDSGVLVPPDGGSGTSTPTAQGPRDSKNLCRGWPLLEPFRRPFGARVECSALPPLAPSHLLPVDDRVTPGTTR